MASGKQHAVGYKIGLGILAFAGAGAVIAGAEPMYAVSLFAGGLVGMCVDPDLRDQHNLTTHSEHRMKKIPLIGGLTGWLWQSYWYPLSRAITHRSFLSHLPILATAIAAGWLIIPWSVIWYLVQTGAITGYGDWLFSYWGPWVWWLFAGWVVQDCIHFIQDDGRIKWHL